MGVYQGRIGVLFVGMRSTQVNEAGDVVCPKCSAKSFSQKRSAKGKMTMGFMAPKRLKCNGCGQMLKRG